MNLPAAYKLIRTWEGCRLKAYPDPVSGNVPWTIGYGTTDGVRSGMVITQAQAEFMMEADVKVRAEKIASWLDKPYTYNQISAMVSLAYNVGLNAVYHSQLLSDFNAGLAPKMCVADFSHFVYAGGKIIQGLVNRRKAEAYVFLQPDPTVPSVSGAV